MIQISEYVYCDPFLENCEVPTKLLPNPYFDYPFLVIEDFFTQEQCNMVIHELQESSAQEKAMVKSTILHSIVAPSVEEEIRKTNIYKLSGHLEVFYQENFIAHQSKIENYFAMALTTSTKIQALEYEVGDFYIKHADDSSELVDKEGRTVGFTCVAPQRKLTTVLFTSSHVSKKGEDSFFYFDGGELIFNYLYNKEGENISFKAKAGDMIIFFSNPYFSHEVKPVISGYRATLVQWHNAI